MMSVAVRRFGIERQRLALIITSMAIEPTIEGGPWLRLGGTGSLVEEHIRIPPSRLSYLANATANGGHGHDDYRGGSPPNPTLTNLPVTW